MRIKLIFVATAIAALAIGVVSSNAALNTETSANVKLAKAGAPASVKLVIDNTDPVAVPQPITTIQISSKSAKFNSKAVPQCKSKIPTNADGDNDASEITPACPKTSRVGTGKFTANTGTAGGPIPAEFGVINGEVNIYNYKPGSGQQAALLIEILSDTPVPNAHQYQLAPISKSGTINTVVPKMEDLPPNVKGILSPPNAPRVVSLAHFETTIKSPKPKRGQKPFFTMKNLKNIDFKVVLQRG